MIMGYNRSGSWEKIIAVAEGRNHIVGLQSNGKVVGVGQGGKLQDAIGHWEDIVAISAGSYTVVGLKSDGTVVGVYTDKEYSGWQDHMIVKVIRVVDEP